MAPKTRSSERQKLDNIFEGLVKMLKTQQQQLETLAKERKILEGRIKMQYERWVSDVRLYEDHISQMKKNLELEEMARVLEAKKADMMVGLKHREAYVCKLKLEETQDELSDFRVWFDILSKNIKQDLSQRDPKQTKTGSLEADLRKLKLEYENLVSKKSSQITALLAESKFAWNQLNLLESQFTDKLNSKHAELEKANQKIEILKSNTEELKLSNAEKDKIIERLKAEMAQRDADASKFHEEVSKMSRQVLRKSRSASCTPVIKHCTAGGRTVRQGKNGGVDEGNVVVKKETSSSLAPDLLKDSGKGSISSKRKRDDVRTISETPKSFTSRFKVPRLKVSSSMTG